MATASSEVECADITLIMEKEVNSRTEDFNDFTVLQVTQEISTTPCDNQQFDHHDASNIFTNTCLAKQLLLVLNEQRKLEQMTDVTLVSGDVKIACHRCILAASSPFFQAMFLDNLRESNESVINLHDVKPDMLEKIVDYLYLGHIEIKLSSAGDLLATACFFQYPNLVAECESFLKLHLQPSNCLGIHQLADSYSRQNLMSSTWDYILTNFEKISLTEEFLSVEKDKLIHLVSDKRLNVNKENIVLNACLRWVNFERNQSENFKSVLECVRLEFVDACTLNVILNSEFNCINLQECKDLIKESLNIQEMMVKGKQVRHPRPSMLTEVPIVVGGMTTDRKWQKDVIFYHEECWYSLTQLPFDHTDYSVSSTKEEMYVIGGFHEEDVCNYVWKYSFANNEWKQISGLQTARCNHASVSLNGKIYVVAGEDDNNTLTSIEVYEPEVNSWSIIGDINPTNCSVSLAALHNKLYIVGPLSFTRVCSLQVFDLETLECTVILTSGMTRAMFPVVALHENLYLLGNCKMKEVKVLNPITMDMAEAKPMKYKRNCPTAAVVGRKIIVTGGELQRHVQKVESFDLSLNKWISESPMPRGLCFHGCVEGLIYLGPPFTLTEVNSCI